MQAAGLDGIELEAYGHLIDQFWSPATNQRDDEYGGSLDNRLRFTFEVLDAIRAAVGPGLHRRHPHGRRRGLGQRPVARGRRRDRPAACATPARSTSSTSSAATSTPTRRCTDVIPIAGHARPRRISTSPARCAPRPSFPVFHAARIADVATARHAIAAGKLDMVGMTRAHIADPHIVRKIDGGPRGPTSAPASAPPTASTASTRAARRSASTTPRPAARRRCRTSSRAADGPRARSWSSAPARPGWRRRASRPSAATSVVLLEAADAAGGQIRLAARSPRRKELIGIVDWRMAAAAQRSGVDVRFNT